MGGDAFKNVIIERVSNQEFEQIVAEITKILEPISVLIKPYIPLPEKQSHGDIDFMVILKDKIEPKTIPEMLKCEHFIYSKRGRNMNCVYRNKQVDFKFQENFEDFDMAYFYKAYSGIGSILGFITYCPEIRLSEKGLFVFKFLTMTIKLQQEVCSTPKDILKFYGLEYQRFQIGFKTRRQLFEYIANSRYFDYEQFINRCDKTPSKIMVAFKDYLLALEEGHPTKSKAVKQTKEEIVVQILQYFHKRNQFQNQISKKQTELKTQKIVKQKFNGNDLIENLKIEAKQINRLKQDFRKQFNSEEEYQQYILNNTKQDILERFRKIIG